MFRNYLASALRNLARNKLYAGINILGLAIGFAAAILIGLFVRNELSFDRFLPQADTTYLLVAGMAQPGKAREDYGMTPPGMAEWMRLDFPQIDQISRAAQDWLRISRGGDTSHPPEAFVYADPNIFSVLRMPVLYGDLDHALDTPDSAVITHAIARKYFGKDNPIGETMDVRVVQNAAVAHTMRITAVLQDLPAETHWTAQVFLSGKAAFSDFAPDAEQTCATCFGTGGNRTYLRLKPGASIADLQKAMLPHFIQHQGWAQGTATDKSYAFSFAPVSSLHHRPDILQMEKTAVDPSLVYAASGFGLLIVIIASINFVNLMTARATRRAVEVGIRKVSGAGQGDLIVQFIGESLLYVTLSMIIAIALVEQFIGPMNAFLDRSIRFDWGQDAGLAGALLGLLLVVGGLAGSYPALVLSAFRPAAVLKSSLVQGRGSGGVRQGLVILQFAMLIGLMISTGAIYRQTMYALKDGTHLSMEQVLIMWSCDPAFKAEVEKLPVVKATTCSTWDALTDKATSFDSVLSGSTTTTVSTNYVDFGFFEFYGIKPLAGRLFSSDYGTDRVLWIPPTDGSQNSQYHLRHTVINEAAVRALGLASASAAVGRTVVIKVHTESYPVQIVGVVPDFSVESVRLKVPPTLYAVLPYPPILMSIKLKSGHAAHAEKLIGRLWTSMSGNVSDPYSLEGYVKGQFEDMQKLATLLAILAGIALFIACLGLFGLAAFTAEQRTKEIGIRKAMGAERVDIVMLLVWCFTKPVLWANLIAWPFAYFLMRHWLTGFAYHIDLDAWLFLTAGTFALAIAWLTIGAHAFLVAGAKPVKALRYE